jgi:hypothetical protein
MEFVTNDDSETRRLGLKNFQDLALCEIIRYGYYNRQEMIGPALRLMPVVNRPREPLCAGQQ